jgi:UDP-glucose:(heptosyl)LPS alpha-1,3-glucosyltransferase
MKIALVIGNYNSQGGGAERWTDRHANYLLSAGHDVHLISRGFNKPPAGAKLHPIDKARGRLRFADRAEQALKRIGTDAIHDMGDGWFGDVFSPHHGTRAGGFLASDEMASPSWRSVRKWSRNWLPRYREFRLLERCQLAAGAFRTVVALSRKVQRDMMRHYSVDPDRIDVVYNGVDAETFRPADCPRLVARRDNIRRAWGWENRVVFLLVAHNFKLKGLDALLRALSRIPASERVGLVVAGNDKPSPYDRMAQKLGVSDRVKFLGDQPDAVPLYQAADAYVQPTYYDPCSLVVLEAMSSGLPTITTTANGAGELLEHGRSGFILDEPTDDESLAEFMTATLDAGFRANAGAEARRTAERNTMAANSARYLALYERRESRKQAA